MAAPAQRVRPPGGMGGLGAAFLRPLAVIPLRHRAAGRQGETAGRPAAGGAAAHQGGVRCRGVELLQGAGVMSRGPARDGTDPPGHGPLRRHDQLEQIVRTFRAVTGREETRNANDRHENRFARWHWADDGSLIISARLSPEDGAVILAALEAGQEAVTAAEPPRSPAGNDSAESLLPEPRNADALVAMAHLALAAPADGAPAPAEIVVVDRAVLTGAREDGRCRLDGGHPARNRPAPRLRRQRCRPSRARRTARPSASAASGAPRRRRCAGRSGGATGAADSLAAAGAASCTPTTLSIGVVAGTPTS